MNKAALRDFFLKRLSETDRKNVLRWLSDPDNDQQIRAWMQEDWELICSIDVEEQLSDAEEIALWSVIQKHIDERKGQLSSVKEKTMPAKTRTWRQPWVAVAAAVIVVALFPLLKLWLRSPDKESFPKQVDVAAPDQNNAVLTLADGRQILLDSLKAGTVVQKTADHLIQNKDSALVYAGLAQPQANQPVQYNTLSLPQRSTPMKLVLADGTLVWLNASSSITFPTYFVGDRRIVKVTGEAYFEVAKDSEKPFFVNGNGFNVRVLGTHFNVRNYPEETAADVTLVEGVVQVKTTIGTQQLRPGERIRMESNNSVLDKDVDMREVLDWKNEEFYFDGANIRTIMQEVGRYYGVEVSYEEDIPFLFVVRSSRKIPVSALLKKLALTNVVHFDVIGNKIIVKKVK